VTGRRRAAVALLLLAALACFTASPLVAAGRFSFPHRPHLSPDAIAECAKTGGVDKDCRGCHDYSKPGRDAHLGGCDKCHVDGNHLEVKRAAATATRPEFQHREHLFKRDGSARGEISCFTCHAMTVDYDFIEFSVPRAGLGPMGKGGDGGGAHGEKTCADCHAKHEPIGGLVRQDEITGDGKKCAVCHLKETSILPLKYRGDARPAAVKPFAHKDHGGAGTDCAACHDAIKLSRTIWDYDPTKGTAEKCASCHVGEGKRSLVAPADEPDSPLKAVDFSNFPHAKHLGEFSKMNCSTCHYPESDEQGRRVFPGRVASDEPVGRSALVNFKACDACHGHDGWGPEQKSWHVDGHGVGAWACFKCHEGVVDAAGKLALATTEKTRTFLGDVAFGTNAHPGVTTSGAPLDHPSEIVGGAQKQCADCHVAGQKTTTSRIERRSFAHEPHVSEKAATSECLACHPGSATARRSRDLDRFDTSFARPGTPPTGSSESLTGCFACHVGASSAVVASAAPAEKVPQFDHANHVRSASLVAGEKGIACVECHVPGGKFGFQIPPDVLNCTKCHGHTGDSKKIERTGPSTSKKGDAGACVHCHEPPRGEESGSIRMPRPQETQRRHLELTRDAPQFHDKGGDCKACHARDGLDASPYVERITSAKKLCSIHEDAAFADKPFNDPNCKCADCHATPPRRYLKALKR